MGNLKVSVVLWGWQWDQSPLLSLNRQREEAAVQPREAGHCWGGGCLIGTVVFRRETVNIP